MRALVTGATGFIGHHVALALLRHGYQVRALVRDGARARAQALLPGDVDWVQGDVRDADSLARAVKGCQVAFHVAALYSLWAARPSDFYSVNGAGTENLLAAAAAGVECIVHTSSVATITPASRRIEASCPTAARRRNDPWIGGDEGSFAEPEAVHS
ncbi:MAG: SDR family NAD(P)-dependent oxidoreductase, partial [Chloroflexota bacterium]|nr:SDR family NAD(P)-dependent oxidoreductase [Chloroflexota bacterium]